MSSPHSSAPTAAPRPARRFLDWLAGPFQRGKALREWRDLDRADRSRIAHDLALGRSELDGVLQQGGGAAELTMLLDRAGLYRTAGLSGTLPDLERVCALCRERRDCRDWLAVPMKPGEPLGVMPGFCPNRDELEALRSRGG